MNDTTVVEMVHMNGEKPKTLKVHINAGEQIIKYGDRVNCLYVLKEGTVMVTPGPRVNNHLTQTEYVGMETEWSILGARPFFSTGQSPFVYTALTDCTIFTFDARMFQTEQDGRGLSKEALLAIARGLVLNSDISEIFVPKIAQALGYDIPKKPNFQELQRGVKLITAAHCAKRFRELIFKSLVKLLRSHELALSGKGVIVGSPALAAERRRFMAPPPIPHSLARHVWETSRL
jgi:CRP-like cAMP-binding protein